MALKQLFYCLTVVSRLNSQFCIKKVPRFCGVSLQDSCVSRHNCNIYWWNCLVIVLPLNWFIHFHFLGSVALQINAPSHRLFQKLIFIIYFLPPMLTRRHQRMWLLCALAQQRSNNFEYCMGGEWKEAWIFSPSHASLLNTFHPFSLPPIHRLILTSSPQDWAGSWRRGEADEKRRCEPSSVSRVLEESLYISLSPQS